jgi:hypothetical protein
MQEWVQLWAPQLSSLDLSYCLPDGDKVPNLFTTVMCRMLLPCSKLTMLTSLSLSHLPVMFLTQQLASGVSTNNMQRASTEQFLEAAPSSSGSAGMLRMQPSGASPAAAPAAAGGLPAFLPALRELCLYDCRVRDEGFLQLSQLTGLTSLRLVEVTLCAAGWAAVSKRRARKAIAAVLQQLQGLETLELQGFVLHKPRKALAPLSTTQCLQHLSISTDVCNTAALAHLATSLTSLALVGYRENYKKGQHFLCATPRTLPRLPLLRKARLVWVDLGPGVLPCWGRCVGKLDLCLGWGFQLSPCHASRTSSHLFVSSQRVCCYLCRSH